MSGDKTSKSPDDIDVRAGARLRTIRQGRKLSQGALAEMIGVTFQQVQKYEKGTNRIGASRLQKIAVALDVPVASFFDGEDKTQPPTPADMTEYVRIVDPRLRKQIRELVASFERQTSEH